MTDNLIDVLIPPLEQPFTYSLPEVYNDTVGVGYRVEVPFGRRTTTGFVISRKAPDFTPEYEIKSVQAAPDSHPCFDLSQLKFFEWVADYYGDTLSNVIDVAVPRAVPQKINRTVVLKDPGVLGGRSRLQIDICSKLQEFGGSADYSHILKLFKGATPALKKMHSLGAIEIIGKEDIDNFISRDEVPAWAKSSVELNSHQTEALGRIAPAISGGKFEPFLLHGVTGSGKTEVYIEAIVKAMESGMGALVIVPEIALTPQLVDRFRARLGNNIAMLHSGLNPRARWDSWRALIEKRTRVAIGARSAIFAPFTNLGLIIVDEEHDSSYKQSDGLRYNARDLALVRGKLESCPVILGSATPSLESFHNSELGRYALLELPQRHSKARALSFELVDMNKEKPWTMASKNISSQLKEALDETISKGQQAFILYNRRGFASYLQCEKCEAVLECSNCSVTLTYHQHNHSLLCHYCNLTSVPGDFCRSCDTSNGATPGKLMQRGAGTEKIFDELQVLYPDVSIARLDRDVVDNIDTYRDTLASVRDGRTQLVVGTQMIAKGHDLPGVTLVGIVDCDVGLHMPDFRAGERTFQLLTQASGRAGRFDNPGRVVLQTRVPGHFCITRTLSSDYMGFARMELANRRGLSYPPFSRLLRVVCSSQEKQFAQEVLSILADRCRDLIIDQKIKATILGPTPAPLEKLKTLWRFHLLVKSQSATCLNRIMRFMQNGIPRTTRLRCTFDMDPQDML